MFDLLRKKFTSWLKTDEKPKKTAKAKGKKESKKTEKPKKEKKAKEKRQKPSKEQIEQERQTTEKVMQDIKQEGIDTTAPEIKVDAAIEEIRREEKAEEGKEIKEEAKIEEENIELERAEEGKEREGEKEGKKSWWPFHKKKKEDASSVELEKETEEQLEPSEQQITAEKPSFFSKLVSKLSTSKLSEQDFNDIFYELEITLLENNTALEAVDKIKQSLKESLVNKEIKKDKVKETIIQALKDAILSILIEPPNLIEQIKEKEKTDSPYVILFFGINGSGKTTSIAKLAHLLKKQKISVVLAAADTFRAASIEQLETHADKIQVPIIKSQYGSDPASVAFEAIKYAKSHKTQVVLIDTAGRMYTKSNLMKEMEKIVRVSKPDLKIFVGESITGNDATEQAKMFAETAGIDGIILSKADVDEKAGTILSVSHVTGKPIYFLGTGQEYNDLVPFTKSTVLKNLGLE